MKPIIAIIIVFIVLSAPCQGTDEEKKELQELKSAQQNQNEKQTRLEEKIKALEEQIKSLQAKDGKEAKGKDLDDLKRQIEDLKDELEDYQTDLEGIDKRFAELEQKMRLQLSSPGILNPAITAFINAALRLDDHQAFSSEGVNLDDKVWLRSAELDIRSQIDPYASAVLVIPAETNAAGELEVSAEEAYATITSLPFLTSVWPSGMKLVAGKFKIPFGVVNKIHTHDLVWTTAPSVIANYLGNEVGSTFFGAGWRSEGAYLDFLLPGWLAPFSGSTGELIVGEVNADKIAWTEDSGGKSFSPFARYQWYNAIADAHELTLGGNVAYDGDSKLYDVDFTYRWKPLGAGEYRSFLIGAEYLFGERTIELIDNTGEPFDRQIKPSGYFAYFQYQFDRRTYAGFRYDHLQDKENAKMESEVYTAYVTYYTTEFLRFRLSVEHNKSDDPTLDGDSTIMLEMNIVYGAHPVEPFWVNK